MGAREKDHVPTREGGYIFDGWYQDRSFTKPAVEGADLTRDVTLYAKWIEPLTISGTISISGTYQQNGETVNVHDIDRATEAVVVLQELHNGTTVEIDSEVVTFGDYDASGSGNYSFTGIPNDGKSYQIHVLVLNYGTAYDNESDADSTYTATEYTAVFGGDTTADVDAHLQFVPPSYDQILNVNASAIGEGFRPTIVLSEVMYRDTGDNHAFQRISQHDVAPYGVPISLNAGIGRGTQSIWKWHTDGTLYDYQMNITKVDGVAYDSDTAPFYITYAKAAYWNVNTNSPSNELVATLIPNQYLITFDLNAGASAVEGMDAYKVQNTENNGQGVNPTANVYQTTHTWSFDTEITAVPVRDGYTFLGWTADVKDAYDNGKINASVYEDVVLTAQWEKNSYTVATVSNPANGGITTGDGIYQYGDKVILTAAAWDGYTFSGWYEGENLLTSDPEFTFFASADRTLTAHFAQNIYQVVAETTTGGTVSGTGNYGFGDTATLNATAEEGYMFRGWYEGNTMVAEDPTYTFTVTGDRTLTAKFVRMYTITAEAQTGGTTTGGGRYEPMTNVTITAEAKSDYNFIGWYDENDNLVTAEATYTLTVMEDRTFTAKFEEKKNYKCDYVYLFGYNDTKIGAEGPLLRGELAQMIYRLVKQNYPGTSNGGHAFGDTSGLWFQSGVSYMAEVGAIDSSKSNAYPYVAVTRGETYKLICLGLGFTDDTDLRPTQYAAILNNHGYDTPEGSVNSKIARYEFCELFNAILGRSNYCQDGYYDTKGNEVTAETYGYTDLDPSASYYRTMMIATSTFTNGKIDIEKRIQRNTYDFNN